MVFFLGSSLRPALIASLSVVVFFILEFPVLSVQADRLGCPEGFEQLGPECYLFSSTKKNWYNAFKDCNANKARLATLSTANDNKRMKNYLTQAYGNGSGIAGWWVGGTDEALEGDWSWSGTMANLVYTDWCDNSGEPNNYGGENCLGLVPACNYQWNDRSCDYKQFRYICEYYALAQDS